MEDLPICSDPVAMEKAFHGEFSPRSWEVLGWQHFCSDKFEMGGKKSTHKGREQLKRILVNVRLFFCVTYSPEFGGLFEEVIKEIDDEENIQRFDDLVVAWGIWGDVAIVMSQLRDEDLTPDGLKISNPKEVAAYFKVVFTKSMKEMADNNGKGKWERAPHQVLYSQCGRITLMTMPRTTKNSVSGNKQQVSFEGRKRSGSLSDTESVNSGSAARMKKTVKVEPHTKTFCVYDIARQLGVQERGQQKLVVCRARTKCSYAHVKISTVKKAEVMAALDEGSMDKAMLALTLSAVKSAAPSSFKA